jgi:tyrosinase
MTHIITAPLGGGVQPRLEINTFVQDDRQFSLYVQALSVFAFLAPVLLPSAC